MTTIVTRAGKGSPLTHTEVDTNFTNLNTAKLETAAIPLGTLQAPSISFLNFSTTGIYSPAGNELGVSMLGSDKIRIKSTGEIIINATASRTTLGITPRLQIEGSATSSQCSLSLTGAGAGSSLFPRLYLSKARSSVNAVVLEDDILGAILFNGGDGSSLVNAGFIKAEVDGTPSAGIVPGRLVFATVDTAGGTGERMIIKNNGNVSIDGTTFNVDAVNNRVGIGTSSVSNKLHLSTTGTDGFRLAVSGQTYYHMIRPNGDGLYIGADDGNTGGSGADIRFNIKAAEKMRIDSSGRLLVGTSSGNGAFYDAASDWQGLLQVARSAQNAVASFSTWNSTASTYTNFGGAQLHLLACKSGTVGTHTSGALASGDTVGSITFSPSDGTNFRNCARIEAVVDGGVSTGDVPGRLVFSTTSDSASSPTERMRIDSTGGLYIGPAGDYANSNYGQSTGNGSFYYRRDNGSEAGSIIASNNADRSWSLAYLNKFAWDSGDDSRWIAFYLNGVNQDSISWTGSAISYGTSSDYRRKTNPSTYAGGLEKVKQLHVREYEWIEFPEAGRTVGFFAHELQEIFPQAVTGVKDGMKIDEFSGEEVPSYQGIDYGKITPLLAAALQEAITKIESLEARLTAAGL